MKIGFGLIVKDEAHVIERCLNSVKEFIDYVYISDTGSSDNTIEVITNWLTKNNIPGKVVTHKWKNFAENRSIVLKELTALNCVDYILMIDADEVLTFKEDPKQIKKTLTADLYDITTVFPDCTYVRPQLTTTRLPFYYKAVVHEYLESDVPWNTRQTLSGVTNTPIQDSSRNKKGDKSKKDILVLENILKTEKDPFLITRYTFYLARTYSENKDYKNALKYFQNRAILGGWNEEVYVSLLEIGKLRELLNYKAEKILAPWYKAFELIPDRLDAIYEIVKYCRIHKRFQEGYHIGKAGYGLTLKKESLFSNPEIFRFNFMDECAINAYWVGKYEESLDIYKKLFEHNRIPDSQINRVVENMLYANQKLYRL